jgi:DNA-binding NtrC family response regulator
MTEGAQNPIVLNLYDQGLEDLKEELERILITKTLLETQGNIAKAARLLKISRPKIYKMMSKYGLGRSKAIVSLRRAPSGKSRN